MTTTQTAQGWTQRARPATLERRFLFEGYEQTRAFLDRLADLSEREQRYPNLSFGRDYVHVTIEADDGEAVGPAEQRLSALIADLATADEATA